MTEKELPGSVSKRLMLLLNHLQQMTGNKIYNDKIVNQQVIDTFSSIAKNPAIQARRLVERRYL
jgi:hypothetical protein